jgi:2-keto-myo-inositol isomerase
MPRRRLALSSVTTGGPDVLTDLAAAHDAGFDALELGAAAVDAYLATGGTLGELPTAFARAGVAPLSLSAWDGGAPAAERSHAALWRRWEMRCTHAAALGCPHVVAPPALLDGASGVRSSERDPAQVLRRMARIACEHAVRVAVELRGLRGARASTLDEARALVETADHEAVGLIIDAFDFYAGGSTWAMLDALDPRLVLFARLEDAEPRPLHELTDAHRLLPGDGVIPLRELVRRLEDIGYDGAYSIELRRLEYRSWEPRRLARAARESIEALCAELDEQEGRLDYA